MTGRELKEKLAGHLGEIGQGLIYLSDRFLEETFINIDDKDLEYLKLLKERLNLIADSLERFQEAVVQDERTKKELFDIIEDEISEISW